MVLRPDGTQAQSFFHEESDARINSVVRETPGGELVFVKKGDAGETLVALSHADPGRAERVIASYGTGSVQSADVLASGRLVVSARSPESGVFVLYRLDENGEADRIHMDSGYHAVEPVAVRPRVVPPVLPSTVNPGRGSGIMLSQDVDHSRIRLEGDPETEYVRGARHRTDAARGCGSG